MHNRATAIIDNLEHDVEIMESAVSLMRPGREISRDDVALILCHVCERTKRSATEAINLVRSTSTIIE